MARYDLTATMAQYLDRHLVIPLFEFLQERQLYDESEVLKAKYETLLQTSMVDLALEILDKMGSKDEDARAKLQARRAAVVAKITQMRTECVPIGELFQKEEVVAKINDETVGRDSALLLDVLKEHGFRPENLQQMYEFARVLYDCGNYEQAEEWQYHYYILSDDPKRLISALWGKFASCILLQNFDDAFEDYKRIRDYIDPKDGKAPGSPLQQLQMRTWLIHWSLFVFFNHKDGRDEIVDLMLSTPAYANAIQTTCPHILRYVATAIITNPRRRNELRNLVKIIQQETYTYRDPITEFLECLYVKFDFDVAQQKLLECEAVLANDIFLVSCQKEFVENARLFILETYCRIHNTISISMLAEKLNMDREEAERWIVNLIRNAKLDAKLDSKAGNVEMATQVQSVYYQVIEKTKAVAVRTSMLMDSVSKQSTSSRSKFDSH